MNKMMDKMMKDYLIGKKIYIIKMTGEARYTGRTGVVTHIDDMGCIHGTWGGLSIVPDMDFYRVIGSKRVFKKWDECGFFKQEHKDFVDANCWDYWLICDSCGIITNDIFRDDAGDECENCHDERYENNESEWLIKYYFDNDVTDEQRNSMKNWAKKDFERECDWEGGENYYYTEISCSPTNKDSEMFNYIYDTVVELERMNIYIDWR